MKARWLSERLLEVESQDSNTTRVKMVNLPEFCVFTVFLFFSPSSMAGVASQ